MECIFLVPTGRGKETDMISPVGHKKVFQWLYQLSKRVSFDIKTTAAQNYSRVVIQQKMRKTNIQITRSTTSMRS